MSAVAKVLDRLTAVRQSGDRRWIALCPSHQDKSPSLSIRETEEGRVLIYCFAGCGAVDVIDSIGLRISDLFEKPISHHLPPVRGGFNARELLELNAHEANVVALLATDAQSRSLTLDEVQRLAQAATRLQKAQDLVHGR